MYIFIIYLSNITGAVLAAAAYSRPDLFHELIIVDSPMFHPLKRILFGMGLYLPKQLLYKYHPIIRAANKKPDYWNSKDDFMQFFNNSKLFKSFDSEIYNIFTTECVKYQQCQYHHDYNNSNRKDEDQGKVELLYSKEHEIDVYYKAPTEIPYMFRRILGLHSFQVPCRFLYSTQHQLLSRLDINWIRHTHKNIQLIPFHQSHFWPLQQPEEFSRYIFDMLCARC